MKRDKIRVIKLNGTPYEMGHAHGTAYRDDIRHYAKDRVELVCSGQWTGHKLSTNEYEHFQL